MSLVLTNATVVDTISRKLSPNLSVVVEGNRIVDVSQGRPKSLPSDSDVIDCGRKFLLPGLMDMHIHLHGRYHAGPTQEKPVPTFFSKSEDSELVSRLHSFLYCGVTTVYDAGNFAETIFKLREQERSGKITSPRIFCAGSIVTSPGGHGSGLSTDISSLPLDNKKLDDHLSKSPDIVKVTYDEHNWGIRPLIPILDMETLRKIVDYCHSKMFRVTSHVSNETRAREAIACGVDALAHPVIQSPITEEFVWLLSEKRIPVVSTLAIGERYSRLADNPEYLDQKLYADCMDEEERTELKTVESTKQKSNRWAMWMKTMTPVAQENLKRLMEGGAVVAAGTDLSFGPDFHRELELLQAGGISPMDVIVAATINAAKFLWKERDLGSIEAGKLAGMVLVDEDPSRDVNNLKKISAVVKDGKLIDRSKLDLPVNKKK
ncbi:MAG: amidohydrolase family protein [Nitrososphaerota archaeon]|nr:amidohydrolase family protein [Nitrososphaerota archaeon]